MRKHRDSVVINAYVNEEANIFEFESVGSPEKQLAVLEAIVIQFYKKYGLDKSDKLRDYCIDFAKNLYLGLGGKPKNEQMDQDIKRKD